ncbi:MAG: exosortase A [Geobacteraceae bacterium]
MTFTETGRTYRWYLVCVGLLLLGLYWKIVPGMALDWYHDENYSHGFLVPLIAGYFLYTRWEELKHAPVIPWSAGLAVILIGLCMLLVGWLGVEYFTMRSSLIVLLAGLALYFFGTGVFRIITLPIAYLFFMVPIPYIIYDAVAFPLKLFVTKVSVATLKMSGVSVLREGNIIMFPSTTLEVADACSGIRSLISLLALAVAYAFFLRITPLKRWLLICAAIPIAIFTNALRVIVTGFLAQYWGAKVAEGFFHEFAGLAVFAVAMVMLVSLGALLGRGKQQTSDNGHQKADLSQGSEVRSQRSETVKYIIVCLLLIVAGLYLNLHKDITVPMNRPLDQFPRTVSGWRMTGESTISDNVQKVLKATDVLSRQYVFSEGKQVNLYIGYHGGGKESGGIHSPKHCLPGSGWYEVSSRRNHFEVNGERINLVRAVYQKGESKEMFIYWFHVKGRTLSEEYSLKLAEITNSILYRRRDSAFVRISVPFEADEQGAAAIGERFIKDFFPAIREFLPN